MRIVSGILVLIPILVTILLLNMLIKVFSGFVLPLVAPFMGDLPQYAIFGLAVLGAALIVYFVGLITTHFVGKRLFGFGEALILKVPIVKTIYAASKQIVDVFAGDNRTAFKAVVMVKFPHPGSRALGFYTGSLLDEEGRQLYSVFIPTTPNPTSGFLLLFPAADVQFTDIPIEDGVKMIVSGGVIAPERYGLVPLAQVIS